MRTSIDWAAPYFTRTDPYVQYLYDNYDAAYLKGPTGRLVNNADDLHDASYYMDSWLKAIAPVVVLNSPGGTPKAVFNKGDYVGQVYSYVVKEGKIWLDVNDPQGKHYGWVLVEPGKFDKALMISTSSGLAWEKSMQESQDRINEDSEMVKNALAPFKAILQGGADVITGGGKLLSGLGENLGLVMTIGLIAVAAYAIVSLKLVKI